MIRMRLQKQDPTQRSGSRTIDDVVYGRDKLPELFWAQFEDQFAEFGKVVTGEKRHTGVDAESGA